MVKASTNINAIAEGIIQGFCGTKILLGITFSQFASDMQFKTHLIIGCFIAIFTAIFYFLLVHKEQSNKSLLKLSVISFLGFAVSSPILFALPFSIFPQREINDAEGIGFLLILASFFITAFVVRLGILVGVLVRNKR